MAEVQTSTVGRPVDATSSSPSSSEPAAASAQPPHASVPKGPRAPPPHQIYKQPAPLRVFPYPSLTANPLSLVHLAVTWLGQFFRPPPSEPSVVHTALWDNETRTLRITDEKSMVDLWQQGFFGKGSLSRSEPNWLKREKTRLGLVRGRVSEVETNKRRAERNRAKWERARIEQEALEQKRLEEAKLLPPALSVEPPQIPLRLPARAPVGPLELLALPNSQLDLLETTCSHVPSASHGCIDSTDASRDGSSTSGNDDAESNTTISEPTPLKRPKSVRFSPTVESTEFLHTDPPRPPRSVPSPETKTISVSEPNGDASDVVIKIDPAANVAGELSQVTLDSEEVDVINKEHLQLLPEEALFLTLSLGTLKVVDSSTNSTVSTKDLLGLLRQNSYSPPRLSPMSLQPDDPFLIHYAVYHHFRSLGWVPRAGIKFGVDWLLYYRGPVFDHAEYGLLVLPSYSDPYWKATGKEAPRKSWHWFMGVNRVLSKVFKRLVLVYVDIPPPTAFLEDGNPKDGMVELLKRYKVREVMVKRWSSNRNRD
ncbi:putative tRNA-splicing endonuclease subunit tsp-2 [Cytospora mali]|uniref:tRNA-intron lyase n=1 Tax=Cytospora mali TaxID=578113 RepID=A0A194USV0_CYTMA|nr:putative tRNA-splicing endonuclease subunit tsp-2 [Valsa mali var. pyri (nom. inval.)]